jgi:hypothetical protein
MSVLTASKVHPAAARSAATRRASLVVNETLGFFSEVCSSAQQKLECASIAVYCQQVPVVPESLPT